MNQWHKCAIALGSNQGDSLATLEGSLNVLDSIPGIEVNKVSSWYQTTPISDIPQPDYLNGCALLKVKQNPQELLVLLQSIELQFGRTRQRKWDARTLDLDILFYDDLILDEPNLIIPHPLMPERAFVLVPLAEIAPNWQDPSSGELVADLAKKVDSSGVQLAQSQVVNLA